MKHPATLLLMSGVLLNSFHEVCSFSPQEVATLTDANFKPTLETGDLWLVEFYAPWCGHCKRLNPLLDELAPVLGERMRIGKLDATIHKRTANEYSIQGYPMLKFKRKGQPLQDYDGPRSKEGLMAFADRMNAPAPEVVSSLDDLNRLRDENEVVFLLAVPRNGPRPPIESAFASVAEGMKHSHAFATIQAEVLDQDFTRPAPFIAKLETSEAPLYYEGSYTATSQPQLKDWVNGNSLPLLSAYAGHNFRRLGEMGKLMVIAVIDPLGGDKTEAFLNRLREVGRSQRDLMAKHFVLGYLDGIRWDGFVRQFNIEKHELPRFFVLDYTKQTFYEDPEVDEVDEIEHFLADIVAGKVPAQRQGALQAGRRVWQGLKDWYPYSLFLLLPVILLLSTCLYPSLWGGDSPEDEGADKEGKAYVTKAEHVATHAEGDASNEGEDANSNEGNAEEVLRRKKDE